MASLFVVKRVSNGKSVENEDDMMDSVEDFIWNSMAEIRGTKQDEN